jgi:hypothetical protein
MVYVNGAKRAYNSARDIGRREGEAAVASEAPLK